MADELITNATNLAGGTTANLLIEDWREIGQTLCEIMFSATKFIFSSGTKN